MVLTEMVIEQLNKNAGADDNNKVILFHSRHNEQIMLPELGYVNALMAYFQLHKIDYIIDQRSNVEFMSPDGQLPLIKYGYKLVSGYRPIIDFINNIRGIESKNDLKVPMECLFEMVVVKAELYYTWLTKDIYETYTKNYYPYEKPWPLNNILCWLKRRDVASRIGDVKNLDNELEGLFDQVQTYVNQDEGSEELLCLVYGHIKAILSFEAYEALRNMVKRYQGLIDFVKKMENKMSENRVNVHN